MRTPPCRLLLAIWTGMFALNLPAEAAVRPAFAVTDLGTYGGSNFGAFRINEWGVVLGSGEVGQPAVPKAFLYEQGELRRPEVPGALGTVITTLDNFGNHAGIYYTGGFGGGVPFIFCEGRYVDLPVPGASRIVTEMNRASWVIGSLQTGSGSRAWFFRDGEVTMLPALDYQDSQAFDLNDANQIVGALARAEDPPDLLTPAAATREAVAFVWQNGQYTFLGSLGGHDSTAVGINEAGMIVGHSRRADGIHHACIFQNGTALDIDTLDSPGSQAARVNRHGHVVGIVTRPRLFGAGTVMHGFLYRDGVMRDLNDLIDPRLGLEIITAQHINDLGRIVGSAQLRGTGLTRAVILTPVEADLIALEANQVVQDLRNSVPLVAGKPTQVRAHVQSTNENLVLSGRLRGFRDDGREIPGSPLAPVNFGGRTLASTNAYLERSNRRALEFLLPDDWTALPLRLGMHWSDCGVHNALPASEAGVQEDGALRLAPETSPAFLINFVRVGWPDSNNVLRLPHVRTDLVELADRLKSCFPYNYLQFRWGTLSEQEGPIIDAGAVNRSLATMRLADGFQPMTRIYLGVLVDADLRLGKYRH